MVVRGAPAIAIAAALSLAVEAVNMESFSGTSVDAADFLVKRLEYLVSRYFLLIRSLMLILYLILYYQIFGACP